jgi:hypothetical protein
LIREWLLHEFEADAVMRSDISFAEGFPHETSLHETATRMLFNHAEGELFDWRETVEEHDWLRASTEANILLKRHNLAISPDSDDYKRVCMGVCLAHLELHGISMERSAGRWEKVVGVFDGGQRSSVDAASRVPAPAMPAPLPSSAPALGDAVKEFLDEKCRPGAMREKWLMDFDAALRLLVRQLGGEKRIDQVNPVELANSGSCYFGYPRTSRSASATLH